MIVFHGSTEVIQHPDVKHSYRYLDFGTGFYVTTIKEQAIRWAQRKASLQRKNTAIVNCYQMLGDIGDLKYKTFSDDMHEWIDFVCRCRDGAQDYRKYDLISGKVADDKVFRIVDLYHAGIWDKERALKEIRVYPNYDQTAFITQRAIERLLNYDSYIEV